MTLISQLSGSVAALLLAASPPPLDTPPPLQLSGEHDVALVVGISDYAFVSDVSYTDRDAQVFAAYLLASRRVPADRLRTLIDGRAARESIEEGVQFALERASPEGTLWVYFAGHGTPTPDGKDGLLAGVDVQQTLSSLAARSVSRSWLLSRLATSRAKQTVVLLDACFSGKSRDGGALVDGLRPLVPVAEAGASGGNVLLFGAASSDETSGPYDAARQGLFTYFAVGGLRGWADLDADGTVTGRELAVYVRRGVGSILADGSRSQTPGVNADAGDPRLAWPLASGVKEAGPDLAGLSPALATRGTVVAVGGVVRLSDVPALSGTLKGGATIDLGVSTDALVAYDAAVGADARGKEEPAKAAEAWGRLAALEGRNPYKAEAVARGRQWREFDERRRAFAIQREADTERLRKLLPLATLSREPKLAVLASYAELYGEEEMSDLIRFVEPAAQRAELCAKHLATGRGATLDVDVPLVDGEPRRGRVLVDGHELGAAPGSFRLPSCAGSIEVIDEDGSRWTSALTLSAGSPSRVKASFPGVVEDGSEAARAAARERAQSVSWPWLGVAAAVVGAGLALDLAPESASNAYLDAMDFAPPVLYLTGGSLVLFQLTKDVRELPAELR